MEMARIRTSRSTIFFIASAVVAGIKPPENQSKKSTRSDNPERWLPDN
jgi:hypothetical protein